MPEVLSPVGLIQAQILLAPQVIPKDTKVFKSIPDL
jgi:hypothetical protein